MVTASLQAERILQTLKKHKVQEADSLSERLAAIEAALAITKDKGQGVKAMARGTLQQHLAILDGDLDHIPWGIQLVCSAKLVTEEMKAAAAEYTSCKDADAARWMGEMQSCVTRLCVWVPTDAQPLDLKKAALRKIWLGITVETEVAEDFFTEVAEREDKQKEAMQEQQLKDHEPRDVVFAR